MPERRHRSALGRATVRALRIGSIALLVLSIVAKPARAEEPEPGPLPALVALGPGLAASGAGHLVAGDPETAVRLLGLQGIGLGAGAVGGFALLTTGASRRAGGAPIGLIVGGVGALAISWIADIYGASGGSSLGGRFAPPPALAIDLGYIFVADPQVQFSQLAALDVEARAGAWRIAPSAGIAAGGGNQHARLELAHRFAEPGRVSDADDGSFLELEGAFTYRRYGSESFASGLAEVSFGGRYDMGRLSPTLAGSFAELGGGAGLEFVGFDVAGTDIAVSELLLARVAYGIYLGNRGRGQGELALYYDHRRDGLRGGLSPGEGNGSGIAGHLGLAGFLDIGTRWGASLDLALGAAFVARAGLRYRFGRDG